MNIKSKMLIIVTLVLSTSANSALIAHYTFDGNANDSSGNGRNGTVIGDTYLVEGRKGNAYYFDGDGDYIDTGWGLDYEFTNGISIQAWIKMDVQQDASGIVAARGPGDGASANYHALAVGYGSQTPQFALTGTTNYDVAGDNSVSAGVWHHLVGTYDNSTISIYVDGEKFSTENNGTVTTLANFEIGRDNTKPWESFRWFQGIIDDVRIYDHALSAAEVQQLAAVPISAAIWLFGSGLLALVGVAKRKKA